MTSPGESLGALGVIARAVGLRVDDPPEPPPVRPRLPVVIATLVAGTAVLGYSLRLKPGDDGFVLAVAVLAAVWTVGSFAAGPLPLGRVRRGGRWRLPITEPVLVGVGAVGVFCAGAVIVAQIPWARESVERVLDHATYGPLPLVATLTLLTGAAEELYFRGSLYGVLPDRLALPVSTAIYTLTTVATGNVMLVFAAAVLGVLVGLQRRATGGILAPIIVHVVWSAGLLFALPPLLDALS